MVFCPNASALEPLTVRVEGVEGEPLKNVEAALTPPSGLVKDGKVDRLWLERFSRKADNMAKSALETYGYYDAQVSSSLQVNEKTESLLLVKVTLGIPTRLSITDVKLQGPGASEDLLREEVASFPLRTGDILLQELYEKAKKELLATARKLGYLDADFSVHKILVNPPTASAEIHLELETGPLYRFGTTTIKGTTYYPEELLRRFITFSADEPFSYKALAKTQVNFVSSAYFKNVSITPHKDEASDYRVPVVIQLEPSPRRTIRPGIGYGTDTGARASISYKDLSLLSPGHIFTIDATIAQLLQGISFVYSIPGHLDLKTVTALQLNLQREDVNDTLSQLMSLEVRRTTGLGANSLGAVFFRILQEKNTSELETWTSFLLLPGLQLSQINYDDLINPSKGYHLSLETRGTSRVIGSDAEFLQIIAEGVGIVPLPWRLAIKSRVKGGTTVFDEPSTDLPTSLRFFAGGNNSVRGYAYKSLGPVDANGDVVGGKKLLQGSVELERALFEHWALSLFYDAGNAFDVSSNLKIYQGTGIGLHYKTPIGAINLDLARQLGVPDPKFRVHFTLGFQL